MAPTNINKATAAAPAKKNNNNSSKKSKATAPASAPPGGPPLAYGALKMKVHDDVAFLQPAVLPPPQPQGVADPVFDTLTVDLTTGLVSRREWVELNGAGVSDVLAVAGLLRLRGALGSALAVVTSAEQVTSLDGEPVYLVTKTQVITATAAATAAAAASDQTPPVDDAQLVRYLERALNPTGAGRGLYFSHGAHLTLSTQRREMVDHRPKEAQNVSLSPARCADRRFFWNRALAQPLLDADCDSFVPTFMQGSVGEIKGMVVAAVDGADVPGGVGPLFPSEREAGSGSTVTVDVQLIARRGVDRVGTRYWRRGADPDTAAVANFVETEQVLHARWADPSSKSGESCYMSSVVQVRGSMPMVWTNAPDGDFKPPKVLLDGAGTRRAFDEHARYLREMYVPRSSSEDASASAYEPGPYATLISLINHHGDEGALSTEYGSNANRFNAEAKKSGETVNPLRFIPFDFHRECSTDDAYAAGLAKLWTLIQGDFERVGAWTRAPRGRSMQVGVLRTNCIDCLDRTNVVQTLIGRKAFARALAVAGAMSGADSQAPDAGAEFLPAALEEAFRNLWADHADAISLQYAGTGALKSDVTRQGKRTLWGEASDGLKSGTRYVLNTFFDGGKQDALDLATGAFSPLKGAAPARFEASRNLSSVTLLPAVAAMAAVAWGASGSGGGGLSLALSRPLPLGDASWVWVLLAVLLALALAVLIFAPYLVDVPRLCPELGDTVAVCVARGEGTAVDLSVLNDATAKAAARRERLEAARKAIEARRAKAE